MRDCYAPGEPRERSYRRMADRMLAAVRSGAYVCAAFYGHPGVFVNPAHQAIRRARREGFRARMLPGISTEDCLFADLGIDPADNGCQSFEATDFLAYRRRFDPTSALILWQVGVLGEPGFPTDAGCRPERLARLTRVLRRHYDERHPIILYEAAQFPVSEPKIKKIPLSKLPSVRLWSITTVYIPRSRLALQTPRSCAGSRRTDRSTPNSQLPTPKKLNVATSMSLGVLEVGRWELVEPKPTYLCAGCGIFSTCPGLILFGSLS